MSSKDSKAPTALTPYVGAVLDTEALPLLPGAIDDPLEALVAGIVADKTRETYTRDVRHFISDLDHLLGITPQEAVHDDLLRWWQWLRRRHNKHGRPLFKPATVNRKAVAIRRFYREGHARGIFPIDAGARLPSLKVSKEPKGRALTAQEATTLLASVPATAKLIDLRDRLVLGFLLMTGCRAIETCRMEVAHLSWDGGHRVVTFHRKGGKEDVQKVPPQLDAILNSWLLRSGVEEGPVFRAVSEAGGKEVIREGPLDPKTIYRIISVRARAAGIGKVTPHDLRRTHITAADEMGVKLTSISKAAGHANPETTMRYIHQRGMLENHPNDAVVKWLERERTSTPSSSTEDGGEGE